MRTMVLTHEKLEFIYKDEAGNVIELDEKGKLLHSFLGKTIDSEMKVTQLGEFKGKTVKACQEQAFKEGIEKGLIKRGMMFPARKSDGSNGFIEVTEGGAIHKMLVEQGVDPFKS